MLAMIIGFILGVFTYYFFKDQMEKYVMNGIGLVQGFVKKSDEMKSTEPTNTDADTDKVEPTNIENK